MVVAVVLAVAGRHTAAGGHPAALRLTAYYPTRAAGIRTSGDFDGVRQAKGGDQQNDEGDVTLHGDDSRVKATDIRPSIRIRGLVQFP